MRQRVLGVIAVVWGAAVVIAGLTGGIGPHTSGAYHGGQVAGFIFGAVFCLAGLRAVLKTFRP